MTQDITLDVAGARVTLPAKTLTDLWLERVKGAPAVRVPAYPKIGHGFPGEAGIYAGLVVGDGNFDVDYHLIVLDGDCDDIKWADAKAWAESISGSLPLRKEQAVMFGNVPQLFEKAWYWSSEQYAGHDEYAWFQGFDGGYQDGYRKDSRCRARAVRRIPI